MKKSELRKLFIAKRNEITPSERAEKSRAICRRVLPCSFFERASYLHCFLPIERFNEIDTNLIFAEIWKNYPHIQTLAPRIDSATLEMKSLVYDAETKLVRNSWGIDEPAGENAVEAEKIDAIFVPLLCADRRGFRVGYGKGFYDRFLKNCRADCRKIGLGFFAPINEIADVNEFDVKLNALVTPEEIFSF